MGQREVLAGAVLDLHLQAAAPETCDECTRKTIDAYGFCTNCGHQQIYGSQHDQQHETGTA